MGNIRLVVIAGVIVSKLIGGRQILSDPGADGSTVAVFSQWARILLDNAFVNPVPFPPMQIFDSALVLKSVQTRSILKILWL